MSSSVYGLRVLYGESMTEREVNLHFKYVDNTLYDIIQHCVFVIRHDVSMVLGGEGEDEENCDWIETICNTFLPITPRPLLQRDNLKVCRGEAVVANYTLTEVTTTAYNEGGSGEGDSPMTDFPHEDSNVKAYQRLGGDYKGKQKKIRDEE